MGSFDVAILAAAVIASLLVFFLPRPAIFGPLILAWAGAAVGVSFGIMYHYDKATDQVHLGRSLPIVIYGLLAGLVPGVVLGIIYRARVLMRGQIEVLSVALLFSGIGMIVGTWMGKMAVSKPPAQTFVGIVVGAFIGLVVGYLQWKLDGESKIPAKDRQPKESPIIDW